MDPSWCLIVMAALAGLLGLVALTIRPRRPDLSRLHPGRLIRGCVVLIMVLIALGLAGLAALVAQR